jgi:hypothetical protein
MEEDLQAGAVRELSKEEAERTRDWVPIFSRPKSDNPDKHRLIINLTDLNSCADAPKFKADTWKTILSTLREGNLTWGITIDLKSWFHHLGMHPASQRWMRMRAGDRAFQCVAMPFGWSASPWWSNKLSKPIRSHFNGLGCPHLWWTDDMLLLGKSREQVNEYYTALINLLTDLGIRINWDKSMLAPAQQLKYVGHQFDLAAGVVIPLETKNELSLNMAKNNSRGTA